MSSAGTTNGGNSLQLALSSSTLNYEVAQGYTFDIVLCEPQSVSGYVSWGTPVTYGNCVTSAHSTVSIPVIITVIEVDKPPVFSVSSLNLSAPGVGVANQAIGFPLSSVVTDPDITAPMNSESYTVWAGACAHVGPRLPSSAFGINSLSGQLFYSSSVTLPIGILPLCVIVTDGGGLSDSLNVSLTITAVPEQLVVYPSSLNVTHYSFGSSSHTFEVLFSTGTNANVTWTASTSSNWLSISSSTSSSLNVSLNSTVFSVVDGNFPNSAIPGVVFLTTSGAQSTCGGFFNQTTCM